MPPTAAARWVCLLLGLSWRSTQASDGDGGLPLLQGSRAPGTAPDEDGPATLLAAAKTGGSAGGLDRFRYGR